MKKMFGIIIMITTVILFFCSVIKAQTVEVKLSVESNVIKVVPDSCVADTGYYVKFSTKDSYTYVVIIDNYDGFFETPINPLIIKVTKKNPAVFQIGTPAVGDTIKYYSVGVQSAAEHPPLPPEAPPRIILNSTE